MSSSNVPHGEKALEVVSVEKSYGTFKALCKLDLTVRRGEFLTLLGPSGSGKTTLLKSIAGFESIDEGSILLEGRNVSNLPPARRDIGMVFQNYALFPHMTVAENVAFPLKMRKVPAAEIERKVKDALARVALPDHGHRYPRQLSGGQQQRVALARAVVFGPKLLLLDEPFGALDRKLREGMQDEVRDLQRRLGLTTVFITHDQEEALVLSDRIAVMDGGKLLQIAGPEEIYARPVDVFTASFVGASNLFGAQVVAIKPNGLRLQLDLGTEVDAPLPQTGADLLQIGRRVTLLVRPEHLTSTSRQQTEVTIRARVCAVQPLGDSVRWKLEAQGVGSHAGMPLIVRQAVGGIRPAIGDTIDLGWQVANSYVLLR